MATQQTVLFARWSAAFYRAMALLSEALLMPELANLIVIRRATEEAAAFYQHLDEAPPEDLEKLARQGLDLADSLRRLLEALNLGPGHPLHETWDRFADEAENLALSVDPALLKSVREARADAAAGRTVSLDEVRRRLGL